MNKLNLKTDWKMLEAPMKWGRESAAAVSVCDEGWYSCNLPCDVRMPLLDAGKIKDPVLADYWKESTWIEDRSWWFRKSFDSRDVKLEDDLIELVLEGLDSRADVFVNGQYIETHRSVHYPFVYNIKELIRAGDNEILLRLTSGMEEVSEADLAELDHAVCIEAHNGGKDRGDMRRSFVRRPQYTVGWDWGPRVVSVGITGAAFIRSFKNTAIREVKVNTVEIGRQAKLQAMVNVENLSFVGTKTASVSVRIYDGEDCCVSAVKEAKLLTSGYNYLDFELTVEDAKLWWPSGYGEQPLYRIEVVVECEGVKTEYPPFRYGIRTIRMDTGILWNEHRSFTVIINEVPIFCKGGNWIPNDFIYARVPEEKYHTLIDEAVEANFNMLRIWGGGLYERDLFYELCSQKGLLIWHDFMFACSTYPDHHDWFRGEMRREFDYQTKRLRNYPAMALWCGTNEVHWIFNSTDNPRWNIEFTYEHQYGLYIANILAKEIIRSNCADIPYWNSSPYGGKLPNDDTVGDVHRWHNALMSLKVEDRIEAMDYDNLDSKFVSEYGFLGPCCLETTKTYMDGAPLDRDSEIWRVHCNVFERNTVHAAIEKNYGIENAADLGIEDYILYGGMVHGLMYGYSLEAMRFKDYCSGGLFWMYNDAWGEVGWTIIDYYLRRKIPYYAVKRALAHQKFAMRAENGKVILKGFNDLSSDLEVKAEFGYVSFDGKKRDTRETILKVPARSYVQLIAEQLPDYDYKQGTVMLYVRDDSIDNIWLRRCDVQQMQYQPSEPEVLSCEEDGDDLAVTVRADGFIHGVYAAGDYACSDAYFDLLPGEEKTFRVKHAGTADICVRAVR